MPTKATCVWKPFVGSYDSLGWHFSWLSWPCACVQAFMGVHHVDVSHILRECTGYNCSHLGYVNYSRVSHILPNSIGIRVLHFLVYVVASWHLPLLNQVQLHPCVLAMLTVALCADASTIKAHSFTHCRTFATTLARQPCVIQHLTLLSVYILTWHTTHVPRCFTGAGQLSMSLPKTSHLDC